MSDRCPALQRSSGWAALVLIAALVSGCGSESEDAVVGPLPTGADDPRAYTEHFLAHNPRAQLQPEHLAIDRLEPTGGDDDDTCGESDGVDCLPYVVAEEMLLRVSDDGSAEQLGRIVLRAADGTAILTRDAGSEPASVLLAPGEYTLELHHLFAGAADAPEQTIFLQPSTPDDGEAEAGLAAPSLDVEGPGETPPPAPRPRLLVASSNCLRCNFEKSDLKNQNFDDKELSGSTFNGATFSNTTLRGAILVGCALLDLVPGAGENKNFVDRFDADFSRAKAAGVQFSFNVNQNTAGSFFGIFRDNAELDGTSWQTAATECTGTSCPALRPDFRNASLRGAGFFNVILTGESLCPPESRAAKNACTFQGADLTGAVFRNASVSFIGPALCRFDKESQSQRPTTLRGADLRDAVLFGGDFSDADLSDAVLEGVDFSDLQNPSKSCTAVGARLTGANLAGAKIAGAQFRGANLAGAVIQGVVPPTFNGLDLTGTNFSNVDFTGIDLSQTDLSKAELSLGNGTHHFDRAKLSDGTHGVNLSGQRFPQRYEEFKGADLTYAILRKTELLEANLEGVTLNNAQLVGANLNFANLHRAKLRGAKLGVEPGQQEAAAVLQGAFMTDVDLTDADLRSVDLSGAHLYGDTAQTLLVNTRLDSADLSDAICSGAHFSGTLNNTVFERAQLVNTVFNKATLSGTKFPSAYLQGADFSNAIGGTGVVLTNAAVAPTAGTWSFMERDGTPFSFGYHATKLGPLATDASVVCPDASLGPCCPSGNLVACATDKLKPLNEGPYPPIPDCVPKTPKYDNCITPVPTATPQSHR